jgi:hypothetical protein
METRYYIVMPGSSYVPHFYEKYHEFMTNNYNVLEYDDVEHVLCS